MVLILRLSALGDVAMASGVVAAAMEHHPYARFVVVTRARFAPLFPEGTEIAVVETEGRHKGLFGLMRLAGELYKRYHPDAVADIHNVIRTRILRNLLSLGGAKVAVIDKGRRARKALVEGNFRAWLRPAADCYIRVLDELHYSLRKASAAPLGPPTPAPELRIGIAPFAAHPAKAYPLEKMAAVADIIRSSRPDVSIYWFSAPGSEADRLSAIADPRDTIVARMDLPGGLASEVELMGTLTAMVAMDSGNMHLAALRGVPVVSVWGATHPMAGFAGATSPAELRVGADFDCRPCSIYGNRPCRLTNDGSFPCLDAIAPSTIAERLLSLLPANE